MERLQRGARADEVALTALYETHRVELFAFLVRMTRDREAAEDLLQETFIRLIAEDPRPVGCRIACGRGSIEWPPMPRSVAVDTVPSGIASFRACSTAASQLRQRARRSVSSGTPSCTPRSPA